MRFLKKNCWPILSSVLFIASLATAPVLAQHKMGTPRPPTTKEGKCAQANGGTYRPNRDGWYTNDKIGYVKCMSGK